MEIPEIPEVHRAAYRWTSDELVAAMRRHQDSELRPSIAWAVGAFATVLAVAILYALWVESRHYGGLGDSSPLAMVAVPAFAIYWTLLRRPLADWQLRRGFSKNPSADQMIEWEVSAKEVKYYQRGLFYTAAAWKNFVKVTEASDGFLLYTHAQIFVWLPFRAFDGPHAPERVREFVRASGLPYRKLAG